MPLLTRASTVSTVYADVDKARTLSKHDGESKTPLKIKECIRTVRFKSVALVLSKQRVLSLSSEKDEMFSINREIRRFYVVLVQRRQRNVQKSVTTTLHVQCTCKVVVFVI